MGSCTFNRGEHPTLKLPSHPVNQAFPNDPTGAKGAYLAWRYGDTADNLTAAGMWAVFHYYAQDAAGTNRASNGAAALVPSLDGIAADSGSTELQSRAQQLDHEAVQFSGQWQLTVSLSIDGVATATLMSGTTPVPDQPISVLVSGTDRTLAATTGTDGAAMVTVPLAAGTVTVVATANAPGSAAIFRGTPASPDPQGAQTLVTGGAPSALSATAQLEVVAPTTTEPATTEPATTTTLPATTLPVTTVPETATTVLETTTTLAATTNTTVPESTTSIASETPTTTAPSTTTEAPIAVVTTTPSGIRRPVSLPRTGGGGDGTVAYFATALLVGGVGLLGTLRRRGLLAYTHEGDAG